MAKEYKDQILDTSVNTKRVYNIVDSDGNIVAENISFEDKTVYLQDGTEFGAQEVNEIYEAIDEVNQSLTTRWNPETDYLEALVNGEWKKAIYLGLLFNGILYESGKLADGFSFVPTVQYRDGSYGVSSRPTNKPTITMGSNSVTIKFLSSPSAKQWSYSTAYIDGLVDLSNFNFCDITFSESHTQYSYFEALFTDVSPSESSTASLMNTNLVARMSGGTNTIDISSLSGKQYLAIGCQDEYDANGQTITISKIKFYN